MGGEWPKVAVAEVCDVYLGGTPKRSDPSYWGGSIKWATAKDIAGCATRYLVSTEETITKKGIKESAAKILDKDTIVITARGTVGALCMLGESMSFNQTCYGLVGKKNKITQHYLYYALKAAISQMHSLSYGTVFNTITMKTFEDIEICLPPLPEQRAIAHILGTLDDKIELNRKMNQTLEAMAQAIFKSWFVDFDPVIDNALKSGKPIPDSLTKRAAKRKQVLEKVRQNNYPPLPKEIADLFPDEFEDSEIGPIPRGWRLVPLPEAIEVNPSRNLKRGSVATYVEMKHMPTTLSRPTRWLRRKFTSGSKFINGDVLLARITPCLENGKTAFVDFLKDGEVGWGSTEYIVLRTKPPLPLEFTYLLARSDKFREYAIANMTGTSGRQRVPASCFDRFLVCIPTEDVARALESLVHPIFHKTKSNDFQSKILRKLHDTLLPKLLNGEIELDAAEALVKEVG